MKNSQRTSNSPFAKLGLSQALSQALQKRMGFRLPTPIQRKSIPFILKGSDVIAMARTGSGKTVAFLAPLIDLLQAHSPTVGVRAVILSPTRELAQQTDLVARKLIKFTNLKLALLIGGSSMNNQFDQLSQNPDIILATPGRLVHHLIEISDFSLKSIKIIVVDEADRLFELGFSDQLKKIWENLTPSRQSIFVSATLPAELLQFSKAGLNNPEFIRLDADQTISEQLELQFIYIRETEKAPALLKIAQYASNNKEKSIIFVPTRHHVEFLANLMIKNNNNVSMVYGKMDHEGREKNLSDFRKGRTTFLVVTDVAARGLDLPEVNRVINYDFPSSNKLFIHRTGRTARAGSSGVATSFVTQKDIPYVFELALYLERKIILPGRQNNEQDPISNLCHIGGLPNLDNQVEFFNNVIKEDPEMNSFYRSMMAAYKLYYKTRNPASNSSVKRSKSLLKSIDGSWKLLEKPHPSFVDQNDNTKDDCRLSEILGELRSFRPSQTKKGSKISSSITELMRRNTQSKKLDKSEIANINVTSFSMSSLLDDISHDASISQQKPNSNQFYLDTSISEKQNSQITTFALENSKLDLNPDEDGEMRRDRHLQKVKWNPTRKKYEKTVIDEHGRILKDSQGKKIKGDLKNKGLYKQWASHQKARIQRLGELEEIKPKFKFPKMKNQEDNEASSDGEIRAASSSLFTQKKKLLENAKNDGKLTHKQARQLKKYTTFSNQSELKTGKVVNELKKPEQLMKLREKRKLKSSKGKKSRMLGKKKWQKKQESNLANRGRNNRSILIRKSNIRKH